MFSKNGLESLRAISSGQLAFHVRIVRIDFSTLFYQDDLNYSDESSDAKDKSW